MSEQIAHRTGSAIDLRPAMPWLAAAAVCLLLAAVGPKLLNRITGEHLITPDAADRRALSKAHVSRLTAAMLYCVDETGHVTTGYLARSTGLPRYDARLVAAIQHWQFEPFKVDGRPTPVCSTTVFIYNQH